jgi:Na+:H+ antiporter
MDIIYVLLVLLAVTRIFGEVAHRFGQPPLLGELVAGIALGLLATHVTGIELIPPDLTEDPVFQAFTDLGIFFLMLFAGVELRVGDLTEASARSVVVGSSGFGLPLVAGFAVAWVALPDSDLKFAQALVVGTALAITAIPVAVRMLMDMGQLETRVGRTIVSAAVVDDVLSLGLISIFSGIAITNAAPSVASLTRLGFEILVFFALSVLVARYVVPRVGKFVTSLDTPEFAFTSLLLAALAFALLAETLGLHFILGAFVAGLLFERRIAGEEMYEEVRKRVSAITVGFLAPVFFASIGMSLDLGAVTAVPVFLSLLILLAFVTKMVGTAAPAFLMGLSKRESMAVGVGMSARGAIELVIAEIALEAGIFSEPQPVPPIVAQLFSAIVIIAIVTTLAAPVALKWIVSGADDRSPRTPSRSVDSS